VGQLRVALSSNHTVQPAFVPFGSILGNFVEFLAHVLVDLVSYCKLLPEPLAERTQPALCVVLLVLITFKLSAS
jgi:ABC-type polysaccharide/polyol phosphate export permease